MSLSGKQHALLEETLNRVSGFFDFSSGLGNKQTKWSQVDKKISRGVSKSPFNFKYHPKQFHNSLIMEKSTLLPIISKVRKLNQRSKLFIEFHKTHEVIGHADTSPTCRAAHFYPHLQSVGRGGAQREICSNLLEKMAQL